MTMRIERLLFTRPTIFSFTLFNTMVSFIFSFYTPTTIGLFVKEDYEHLQGVLWLEGKDTVLPSVTPEGSTRQIIPIVFFFLLLLSVLLLRGAILGWTLQAWRSWVLHGINLGRIDIAGTHLGLFCQNIISHHSTSGIWYGEATEVTSDPKIRCYSRVSILTASEPCYC